MLFTMRETYVDRNPKMALPAQNINHSAFRSMFEREKLPGNNFIDWFCQLKLVLRVEKKMYFIEQPLPAVPIADSEAQSLNLCLKNKLEWRDGPIQFHACKQEEGKPVAAYVLLMKGYVDQLERLGYMLPQDLIVGLILNGLTKDFAGFVRNYNMHNMGKTIGKLHAMLIEYEKGILKRPDTHNLKPPSSAKSTQLKDDTATTAWRGVFREDLSDLSAELLKKEASWLCPIFRARKLKQGALYLYVGNGVRAQVEAIGSYELVLPNGLGCEALVKRDTPDKLQQRSVKYVFIGYPKETMGYYFYFPPENKIVVASEIPMEVEGFKPPQEEEAPVRRPKRPHRAPNRLCLNVEVEEHSLGDLNEPDNYKAAMLDHESNKWLDAMNVEMKSMKDNQVWRLVDLPLNGKTVGSK
ncbi:retrotransposon protein, putative, ty1-copia subclass [Tanacetum coccineum]